MVIAVVLNVSAAYNKSVLTLVFEMLALVLPEISFEFYIFSSCINIVLVFPFRAMTSASDLACSSIVLPKYVMASTPCRALSSCAGWLFLIVLYFSFFCRLLYILIYFSEYKMYQVHLTVGNYVAARITTNFVRFNTQNVQSVFSV